MTIEDDGKRLSLNEPFFIIATVWFLVTDFVDRGDLLFVKELFSATLSSTTLIATRPIEGLVEYSTLTLLVT